jgi:hypothetical protein
LPRGNVSVLPEAAPVPLLAPLAAPVLAPVAAPEEVVDPEPLEPPDIVPVSPDVAITVPDAPEPELTLLPELPAPVVAPAGELVPEETDPEGEPPPPAAPVVGVCDEPVEATLPPVPVDDEQAAARATKAGSTMARCRPRPEWS